MHEDDAHAFAMRVVLEELGHARRVQIVRLDCGARVTFNAALTSEQVLSDGPSTLQRARPASASDVDQHFRRRHFEIAKHRQVDEQLFLLSSAAIRTLSFCCNTCAERSREPSGQAQRVRLRFELARIAQELEAALQVALRE